MPHTEKENLMFHTLASMLRASLFAASNDIKPPCDTHLPGNDDAWQGLFDLAQQQGVLALTYDAIMLQPKEKRPSRRVLFHFMTATQSIEREWRQREQALADYAALMHRELGITTYIAKGSATASHYPIPQHRECGDNDIYIGFPSQNVAHRCDTVPDTESSTASVTDIITRQGIEVNNENDRHITFTFEETLFECHTRLTHQDREGPWCFTVPYNSHILMLQPEQEAYLAAEHMIYDSTFFDKPLKMRNLTDWCMLLSQSGFSRAAFADYVQGTDVAVFADLMTAYCNHLFGLSLPTDYPTLERRGLTATDFATLFMNSGQRHHKTIIRVARRSWRYLRHGKKYRAIFGQSMFRRFYLKSLITALRNRR